MFQRKKYFGNGLSKLFPGYIAVKTDIKHALSY